MLFYFGKVQLYSEAPKTDENHQYDDSCTSLSCSGPVAVSGYGPSLFISYLFVSKMVDVSKTNDDMELMKTI